MKALASILAFSVIFISATGIAAIYAFTSPSHPVQAFIIAVIASSVGSLAGQHAARATSKQYDQRVSFRMA
ncbi:MAG: hypothetical protein AB9869_24540 [Verrucomicrobiia bacterium]